MSRRYIASGFALEEVAGYSRAVIDGEWIFVAGTTGFDYAAGTISDDVVAQTEQAFRNIEAVLAEAGGSLEDVVRVQYTLVDRSDFELVAPVFGHYFSRVRPAATAVIAGLVDPRMKIEIEVTARRAR